MILEPVLGSGCWPWSTGWAPDWQFWIQGEAEACQVLILWWLSSGDPGALAGLRSVGLEVRAGLQSGGPDSGLLSGVLVLDFGLARHW